MEGPLRAVALGRTSPAKGYETIARAAELAGVELEIRGTSGTAEERDERERLVALGAHVLDPVPYSDVPALLAVKDVLVDNMREGALDKVVYEAAATCLPVLASNSGFDDVLPPELRFARHDPEDLAEKLRALPRSTATISAAASGPRSRSATQSTAGPSASSRSRSASDPDGHVSRRRGWGLSRSRPGGTCPHSCLRPAPRWKARALRASPVHLPRQAMARARTRWDCPQPWLGKAGPLQRRGPGGEGRASFAV